MFRRKQEGRDIVHRWEGNPLIRLEDLGFRCADLRSAGVTFFQGKPILLTTIQHLSGHQSIHLARSDDKGQFHVEKDALIGANGNSRAENPHESEGVMDARITLIDGKYYIMYMACGDHGFRLGLATTTDFVKLEYHGLISEPDTKGGALFSEKINGRYARLERPGSGKSIWISYSDDLVYWGGNEVVLSPRSGFWDSARVGTGAPPIRFQNFWLLIYYGVKKTSAGPLFRLGVAMLDSNDPTKLIGRANIPILSPREDYERIGDQSNIVYCTGAFIQNENELQIVYNSASSCICMGSTTIHEIIDTCVYSKEDF